MKKKTFTPTKGSRSSVVCGAILNPVAMIDRKIDEDWDSYKHFKVSILGRCYLPTEVMTFIKN